METSKNEKAQSAEEVLNKYVKGDLKRDYNQQKLDYNTVYLSTTLKAMKEFASPLQSRITQLESELAKSQEKCKAYERSLKAIQSYTSDSDIELSLSNIDEIAEQALKANSNAVPCSNCGAPWDTTKHNSCSCGAYLVKM